MTEAVEVYLTALPPDQRVLIETLRSVVLASGLGMVETIKWNAPSFALDGEDRITLGLERKGGACLVLHRGAKARPIADLSAVDPDGLAAWPSPDRGVATFRTLQDILSKRHLLTALCLRWVAAAA